MEACRAVYEKLNELHIPYEVVEHPAVYTTDEADAYIEGREGVRTKSLFLTNKKKTAFYLLVMDEAKRLDIWMRSKPLWVKAACALPPRRA